MRPDVPSPAEPVLAPSPHDLEVRLRRRVERAVEALGTTALRFGVDALARHLTRPLLLPPDLRPHRHVVVLSGGIRSTGRLNATTVARVRHAVEVLASEKAELLVVSGGPRRRGRPSAAPAMRALAITLGVAPERIVVEERSSRTSENAREVAALLERGTRGILLVTSALHMRRAVLCFRRHGISAAPAPVPHVPDEDPERATVVGQVLHELIGLAYYRFAGWL
ncbi:YdcF family protein [Candidatus Binatia bacterium]|jgi:uncharacterized SAM-binding protein YcdF (DUF218 family)|nr:YdcF family protein [Candidatus Binatia bacterium]